MPPAKSDGMKIHLKRGEIYRGKGPRAAPAKHSGKVCGHVQGSTGRGASPRAHGALGIAAFAPCWSPQSHLRSSGTLGTEPRGQPGLHKSTLEPGGKTRDLLLATCWSSTGYRAFCKNPMSPLCLRDSCTHQPWGREDEEHLWDFALGSMPQDEAASSRLRLIPATTKITLAQ